MPRLGASAVVRVFGSMAVLVVALAFPIGAAATVTGGCQATGTSTSGGTVDLTATPVWHLRSTDTVTFSGTAPFEQFHGSASASVLGFSLPLASGEAQGGQTAFTSDAYDAGLLARLGRVFVVSGASSSAFHGCAGDIQIVLDDVNPLATVLGAGAVGGIAVGLTVLIWGLRRPDSGWRRLVGLLGMAFAGGGAATLLQQVSTPGQAGPAAPGWTSTLAGPTQVSLDPVVLVGSAALALALVVVMPFPAELFNKTLEANLAEIRAAFARLPIVGGRFRARAETSPASGSRQLLTAAAVVLAGALLYGFLDPSFGPDLPSAILFIGLAASLVTVTWLANLPLRVLRHRLTGDAGRLWAAPATLLVAAGAVLLSRIANFEPGYLYGLIVGYAFVAEVPERDEGRGLAGGAWWMLGIAVVAWFALGAVRMPGIEPSLPAAVLGSVFAALTVAGIEGIVFGMLPLRFLHGEPVFRWSHARWAVLYGLGLFAFFWIILDPANGFLSPQTGPSFVTAVALFAVFGIGSVLFWAYFRGRHAWVAAPERPL